MATSASIGHTSTFLIGNDASPVVYTAVAEVYDITPPSDTMDVIDATHMTSPSFTREFIAGLIDPGEASFEMNFIPGVGGDLAIQALRGLREKKNLRIVFPNTIRWSFAGYLIGYEPAVPDDDKMTATVSFKVTGSYLVAGVAAS